MMIMVIMMIMIVMLMVISDWGGPFRLALRFSILLFVHFTLGFDYVNLFAYMFTLTLIIYCLTTIIAITIYLDKDTNMKTYINHLYVE